jgi:hypothetical protein
MRNRLQTVAILRITCTVYVDPATTMTTKQNLVKMWKAYTCPFSSAQRLQRRVDKDGDCGRQIHADVANVAAVDAKLGCNRVDVPVSC